MTGGERVVRQLQRKAQSQSCESRAAVRTLDRSTSAVQPTSLKDLLQITVNHRGESSAEILQKTPTQKKNLKEKNNLQKYNLESCGREESY